MILDVIKGYFAPLTNPLMALGIGALAGIFVGYKVTTMYYDAKQSKVDQAVIGQLVEQASIDRKVIANYQIDVRTLQNAYIELGRKAREVKITTNKCTLTNDGVRLWNESLLGEAVLPGSSAGVDAAIGSSSSGIDFGEAFQNKLLNDQKANENRAKIKRTWEWCVKTFGEDRCKGK